MDPYFFLPELQYTLRTTLDVIMEIDSCLKCHSG